MTLVRGAPSASTRSARTRESASADVAARTVLVGIAMSVAVFLFCGLVVGAVAQAIAGERGSRAWIQSMSLGVLGAMLGGLFGIALHLHDGQPAGVVMAIVGAAMLVVAHHVLAAGRRAA